MVMDSNSPCRRHEDGKLARPEGNVSCAVYSFRNNLILSRAIHTALFPQGIYGFSLKQYRENDMDPIPTLKI